jgi:hypothetical protein
MFCNDPSDTADATGTSYDVTLVGNKTNYIQFKNGNTCGFYVFLKGADNTTEVTSAHTWVPPKSILSYRKRPEETTMAIMTDDGSSATLNYQCGAGA